MVELFALAEHTVTREHISQWLKKDNDSDFVSCSDTELAIFLNGFINDRRGKKPGPQIAPEKRVTNNIILTKLKIALNLQAEDIIELLNTVDFRLSKPELSAFARKVDHKHYRECKDQVIRNFLNAIDKKYHVARTEKIQQKPVEGGSKASQKVEHKKFTKKKPNEPFVEGARPNASTIYQNPKVSTNPTTEPNKNNRKILKLK
ncbi:hypothetical protein GCM10009111_16780 [Colwellia asteriadis]|uniref:DUF1456 domain-containing protein n=1 Tax=Colwellia asteriadis TaxID=517723 RepID=A0ABP3WFU5_9GAMM